MSSRAPLLGDEEPGDLALHVHVMSTTRVGGSLDARGDIRRVSEDLAAGSTTTAPALEADARRQLRRALGSVPVLRSESARWIASAARTARSASFSCACG